MGISKMLRSLRTMLTGKPLFLLNNPGKIVEAFVHNGTTYYTFVDMFQMPTVRGLQALDYYDEFNMRCTKDFLLAFVKAQREILSNAKKLDLIKLATLTKYLEERLEMIPVPDHVYRLASVMFFDKTEDPYFFDRNYAGKKIDQWKKDPEILSFFLQTPLKDLIPASTLQDVNLQSYSAAVDMINQIHLKEVLSVSSVTGMRVDM